MAGDDDDDIGEEQVEKMVEWFLANYEDPVHSQPVDGGEYVWLVDSYDAREEIEDHFPNVPEPLIEKAVDIVQQECFEWVKSSDLSEENFTR